MNNRKTISNIGGAIAVISILFLPVVGCGGENVNGIQIIQSDHVSSDIKAFFSVAIICGGLIFLFKNYVQLAITGIVGILSLLIGYLIAKDKINGIDLKAGGVLGIIGFLVTTIINFLDPTQEKK
jgi:hypothetical protein